MYKYIHARWRKRERAGKKMKLPKLQKQCRPISIYEENVKPISDSRGPQFLVSTAPSTPAYVTYVAYIINDELSGSSSLYLSHPIPGLSFLF